MTSSSNSLNCSSCGASNRLRATYCQRCGQRLSQPRPAALSCPKCGAANPPEGRFCHTCGAPLQGHQPQQTPRAARLVCLNKDGTDGRIHSIETDVFDIGRRQAHLNFDDPQLAARHARIRREGTDFRLIALERRNGVYRQIREPTELVDGDRILLGKQVLHLEAISEAQRSLTPVSEDGVVLFGTPVAPPWARLRQLTAEGTARDVYHLVCPSMIVGRETGDLVFTQDEFMSRSHARISKTGDAMKLEDLNSSNGTFVRIRHEQSLRPGEVIRLGDERLRFELI